MRVVGDRCAVRGPAGVRDAGGSVQASVARGCAQVGDAGGASRAAEPVALVQGQPARVIAAVFEA